MHEFGIVEICIPTSPYFFLYTLLLSIFVKFTFRELKNKLILRRWIEGSRPCGLDVGLIRINESDQLSESEKKKESSRIIARFKKAEADTNGLADLWLQLREIRRNNRMAEDE